MTRSASPFNLPNDLWKQSVSTGNYAKDTWFDALWRPLLVRERDVSAATSDRFTVHSFDADGREVFTSYPLASVPDYTAITLGTRKTFDVLGRLYQTTVDSGPEHGPLTTTVDYIGGINAHTKRITSPRGLQTEIDFMVYDEASEELPLAIRAPEGMTITFDRDAYGKPKSITRSGTSPVVSATRRYVYDANQRLCMCSLKLTKKTRAGAFGIDLRFRVTSAVSGLWLAVRRSKNMHRACARQPSSRIGVDSGRCG